MPLVNTTNMPYVSLYTDGSWKKRCHAGGWACLMVCGTCWKLIADGEPEITVNRAELTAIIKGLEALQRPCTVDVISDSMYSVNCINKWISVWEVNGWRNICGESISNQDLLIRLRELMLVHQVRAFWVKAHTQHEGIRYLGNAVVDAFAQLGSEGKLN